MNCFTALLPLLLLTTVARADTVAGAPRDCASLRQEIADKLEANGITRYSLQIVDPEGASVGEIVGSCDAGTRRIAYQRIDAQTLAQVSPRRDLRGTPPTPR